MQYDEAVNERHKSEHIFIIGPASVGKTTVGEKFARSIDYNFVDIDERFILRYGDIVEYIKRFGYDVYCATNDSLTDEIVANAVSDTVFVTPSGYAVYEDLPGLADKQRELLKGIRSVLLLSSQDPEDSADMIATRQIERWPEANYESERIQYIGRHALYRQMGDVKIIGRFSVDQTVSLAAWGLGIESSIDN